MQALQQTLYSDFARAVGDKSDASDQALATKNARAISERYEKARIELRENIDVLTRKAEVYIDWASDTYRDPAEKHNVDDDPLSRQVLRDYAFDCSDKFNFPAFGNVHAPRTTTRRTKEVADDEYCAIAEKRGVDETTKPKDAFIRICAGPNDKARQANLLVQRQAPRPDDALLLRGRAQQAGGGAAMGLRERPRRREGKRNPRSARKEINAQFDDLAGRISAFSSLALYQMEQIRVKYRPVGFWCSVPLVRNIPSLNCFPIRTASLTR